MTLFNGVWHSHMLAHLKLVTVWMHYQASAWLPENFEPSKSLFVVGRQCVPTFAGLD